MKNIAKISFFSLVSSLGFAACDSVSEPDRFVPAEIIPERAVLIEEFTGQFCRNCPDGHTAIKEITATLGDSVVAVCIHASSLALDVSAGGLKNATGQSYYESAGSPELPTAVINMQTDPLQVQNWGASINHIIINPTPFTVKAKAEVKPGNTYDIDVAFSSGTDYEGKLMVWILEDDIIGLQDDHGTWIRDYEHNHVFRACVTENIWGEEVTLKAHNPEYRTYSYNIDPSWNPDNLYVVAFLYNDAGVAQVTESKQ